MICQKFILRSFESSNFFKYAIIKRCKTQILTENEPNEKQTHFGFQTINESEKSQKVHKVFQDVARNYDKMNDAMSFGIHRIWKDIFMMRLAPTKNTKLLDVAGGTGDIAFRFLNYMKHSNCEECHVVVSDINENMLKVGKQRSEDLKYNPKLISWQQADAESLPFKDNSFNAYTIAFGLRNVTHIEKALEEAYRVLQPGGRFMCLEFSQLNNSTLQWFYDQYSFQVIPTLGHIIAGQWHAYQYLVESIRKFPNQEKLLELVQQTGFQDITYENLSMGIVAIHSGFKL
ncbi:hypothetical protein WA026_015837 [Henosepilachna vigintioctopunctata]|uniref:2-methoxy-6-polyprenyl-1,4-benzoquinol methylase, mitochondrial n=1 Tax=Henosepilachna vigintioctopunctata TaxID=420089 RepID=A0AAW1V268_9CUCU